MTPLPCVDKSLIMVRGYQCRSFVVFVFCSKNEKKIYIYWRRNCTSGAFNLPDIYVPYLFSTISHTFMLYLCLHANDFRVAEVGCRRCISTEYMFPDGSGDAQRFYFFFLFFSFQERNTLNGSLHVMCAILISPLLCL